MRPFPKEKDPLDAPNPSPVSVDFGQAETELQEPTDAQMLAAALAWEAFEC